LGGRVDGMSDEDRTLADFEGPTPEHLRAWAQDHQGANWFLLHSAQFYLSARRLLVPTTRTSVMPGLVCGAYGLEQVIKAALAYKGITWQTGSKGHDLRYLAGLLPTTTGANATDLQLFTEYFNSRYFDNKNAADGLDSSDYTTLDNLYYTFYENLDIPLPYHCRVGLLAIALDNGEPGPTEREILELGNAHFNDYVNLRNRSSTELRNAPQ
jgi:hypothetical protein